MVEISSDALSERPTSIPASGLNVLSETYHSCFKVIFTPPVNPVRPRGVGASMAQIHLGHITVDPERNRILGGGQTHRITAREMAVLTYLMQNGTRVVPRQELLDSVWHDAVVNEEALTLVISRLRAALSDNPKRPRIIETIPKKGYRLMVEAAETGAPRPPTRAKRAGWVWATILAVLLIVMTALFTIVRIEYERVGALETETVAPSEQR